MSEVPSTASLLSDVHPLNDDDAQYAGPGFESHPHDVIILSRLATIFSRATHDLDRPPEAIPTEIARRIARDRIVVLSGADRMVLRACLVEAKNRAEDWLEISEARVITPRVETSQARGSSERDRGAQPTPPPAPGEISATPQPIIENSVQDLHIAEDPSIGSANNADGDPVEQDHVERKRADTHAQVMRTLTLDQIARAPHSYSEVVVVVWAMAYDAASILDSLHDEREVQRIQEALRKAHKSVVIVTRDEYLPIHPEGRKLAREIRDVSRELTALGEPRSPKITVEQATAELSALLKQLFHSSDVLLDFARSIVRQNERPYMPLVEPLGTLAPKVVEFLQSHGYISSPSCPTFFAELLGRRSSPENEKSITRVRQCVEAYHGDKRRAELHATQQRIEDDFKALEQQLQALPPSHARLDRRKPARLPRVVMEIDSIAIMLANRVSPDLAQKFEEQRARGIWGESDGAIVEELRTCIEFGDLKGEILGQANPDSEAPSADRLGKLETVELLALFVAAFLPQLDPDEYELVMQGLLELEQAYIDRFTEKLPAATEPQIAVPTEAGDERGSPAAAPPTLRRTLRQIWAVECDLVLAKCLVVIREIRQSERVGLIVAWSVRKHALEWKTLLRQHRHYFVTRQIDNLRGFRFLEIDVPTEGKTAFDKILSLQIAQAEVSPKRRRDGWADHLISFIVTTLANMDPRLDSLGLPADDKLYWQAQVNHLGSLTTHQRMGTILKRLHMLDPRADIIGRSLNRLTEHQPTGCWLAMQIVPHLADVDGYDGFPWLRKIDDKGDGDARERVRDSLVSLCLYSRAGHEDSVWAAVSGWLGEADESLARTGGETSDLGPEVAARVLVLSTDRQSHLDRAIWRWCGADSESLPTPLTWIFSPALAWFCERRQPRAIDAVLGRVLLGRGEMRQALFRELQTRFRDELEPRENEQRKHWYPIFLAGVLVLWMLRLLEREDPSPIARQLALGMLAESQMTQFALAIVGVTASFAEVISQTLMSREDLEPASHERYEQMLNAIAAVQGPLEAHIRAENEIKHG